ncbi:MAG: hypothetical protein VXW87_04190 [Pseudomonadota bacterium]|nr:hypothetical protein [Pseudomonadota bacterium]
MRSEKSELFIAIETGNTGLALALIAKGADLDTGKVMGDGGTVSNLFLALEKANTEFEEDNIEIPLALIAKGADLDKGKVMGDGGTISNLFLAIKKANTELEEGNIEIPLALIAKGANLDKGEVWNGGTLSNLCLAIYADNEALVLELIAKGAMLSVRAYNEAIQKLDYAKALVQRFDREEGFPSLGTLCMFNLPLALHNSELPKYLVRKYDPYKDIEFLKKHRDDLHLLSPEITEEDGFPQKALSMFKL